MRRTCSGCGNPFRLYLHRGQLFCYRCLPADELPLTARAAWAIHCARKSLDESQARRQG